MISLKTFCSPLALQQRSPDFLLSPPSSLLQQPPTSNFILTKMILQYMKNQIVYINISKLKISLPYIKSPYIFIANYKKLKMKLIYFSFIYRIVCSNAAIYQVKFPHVLRSSALSFEVMRRKISGSSRSRNANIRQVSIQRWIILHLKLNIDQKTINFNNNNNLMQLIKWERRGGGGGGNCLVARKYGGLKEFNVKRRNYDISQRLVQLCVTKLFLYKFVEIFPIVLWTRQ